jgi:hypothetical protein
MPLCLQERVGCAEKLHGALKLSSFQCDAGEAIQVIRDGPFVASCVGDLQGLSSELLRAIQVTQLPLDHRQIGGFAVDRDGVA